MIIDYLDLTNQQMLSVGTKQVVSHTAWAWVEVRQPNPFSDKETPYVHLMASDAAHDMAWIELTAEEALRLAAALTRAAQEVQSP